ncbi:MAG: tetratricopeptide repeat protein [Syntrophaceae bacterium]|nr:tetratricopeptide repeat protein [Syntrophaceae bacterium]
MINKANGFDLNIRWRWRFPGGREYAFAFIALFAFLILIYSNSFQGAFIFDDEPNIVQNSNIFIKSLDWPDIKKTFYGIESRRIDRPVSFLSFALNYYFHGLDVFGFHVVNFAVHFFSSIFLFLFIFNTLKLPKLRERYGPASYSIALLATVLWAVNPVQVSSVTYIVQRMASMAGLFYIVSMYFYLKGRTAAGRSSSFIFFGLCAFFAVLSLASKENAVLLPVSVWLYDFLLIQGATRENLIKNLKILAPVILIIVIIGFQYVNVGSILSGAAYKNRPFTLAERLLTEPRVIIFYITLLLYPIGSRLTLLYDIELSTSLLTPWDTLPAIALIFILMVFAGFISRKRPLIAFSILFFFLNHLVEGSFIALDLIYEHRNYIPSMFFFVPVAVIMVWIIDYFSHKRVTQWMMAAVFVFLLFVQGHTVYLRNTLFHQPIFLWSDNVEKSPRLSRPMSNLGLAYGDLGYREKAYEYFSKAVSLNRHLNIKNNGVTLANIGLYHSYAGDCHEALRFFQKAINVYPNFWPAYKDAAVCLVQIGNLREAQKIVEKVLPLWPENPGLKHIMGFVLLKAGEYEKAMKEARRALELNPGLHGAWGILGEASRKTGNYRRAAFYWKRYLQNNPNDPLGNLAFMELCARLKDKDNTMRMIGKMMSLKGSKKWREYIEELVKNNKLSVYEPQVDELVAIIKNNIADQLNDK